MVPKLNSLDNVLLVQTRQSTQREQTIVIQWNLSIQSPVYGGHLYTAGCASPKSAPHHTDTFRVLATCIMRIEAT